MIFSQIICRIFSKFDFGIYETELCSALWMLRSSPGFLSYMHDQIINIFRCEQQKIACVYPPLQRMGRYFVKSVIGSLTNCCFL